MVEFNRFQAFQSLGMSKKIVIRFSFQTTYGLIVTASECGRINVQFAPCLPDKAGSRSVYMYQIKKINLRGYLTSAVFPHRL